MSIETIYKVWCPKCDKHCYVNNGDTNDPTGVDNEGVQCPYCKKKFVLHDDILGLLDKPSYTLGKKTLD